LDHTSDPAGRFGKELSGARDFGWAAACASEVGDADTLQRLFAYADRFLNPIWQDGAYFYQRRDGWFDEHDRLAAMDPHTGNALLAYARLNVSDGLRKLYDKPWDESHFREPALVDMPDDLDVRGARYDVDGASLLLDLRAGGTCARSVKIGIANVWNRGEWTLHIDDEQVGRGTSAAPGSNAVALRRDGDTLVIEGPLAGRRPSPDLALTWQTQAHQS
jgi:hypothetical protein